MSAEQVEVCRVGGQVVMGSPMERDAALLNEGDEIVVDGVLEVVDYTWFYEGVIVKCKSGKSIHPALGHTFSRPTARTTAE
jgi:hypothetical protein